MTGPTMMVCEAHRAAAFAGRHQAPRERQFENETGASVGMIDRESVGMDGFMTL